MRSREPQKAETIRATWEKRLSLFRTSALPAAAEDSLRGCVIVSTRSRSRLVERSGREQLPSVSRISLQQGKSMGRIDRLLAAMTLEEKIGQLNMAAASRVVTGPGERRALDEGIRAGRIGNVLNLWGADEVRALQRLAVEESRLGIPLLLGLDVIHGHRTIFPVPLAEACLFDPDTWERTARSARPRKLRRMALR